MFIVLLIFINFIQTRIFQVSRLLVNKILQLNSHYSFILAKRPAYHMFQPFKFCLSFKSPHCSLEKINSESILISPQTNVQEAGRTLCQKNNLDLGLAPYIADSILDEIQKQTQTQTSQQKDIQKQQNRKEIPSKPKNFKQKFCRYLTEIENEEDSEYNLQPLEFLETDDYQLSFRPSHCNTQMIDFNDDSRISWETTTNYQKSLASINKPEGSSNSQVFENLYRLHHQLQIKRQQAAQKSLKCYSFKPQINPMSAKIVEKKRKSRQRVKFQVKSPSKTKSKLNTNTSTVKNTTSINLRSSQSQTKLRSYQNDVAKKGLSSLIQNQENKVERIPKQSCLGKVSRQRILTLKQNQSLAESQSRAEVDTSPRDLNIYQRGEKYLRKSQEKISRMINDRLRSEMEECTFKPRLNHSANIKSD